MVKKEIKFIFFGIYLVLLLSFISAASSTGVFSVQYSNPFGGTYDGLMNGPSTTSSGDNQEFYDVEFMIPPTGCQPYVVRSDLLEEQNVPVFCQLVPLKVNPGININRIESINVVQKGNNPYISGVGFHPANAAIGASGQYSNNPLSGDIGYVVVVLKRIAAEKDMPEGVNVTLSAQLQFRAENSYGIGESEFYVPVLSNDEFANNYNAYSFFEGLGYLKVESIDQQADSAVVAVYQSDGKSSDGFRRVFSSNIEKGKVSSDFYLNTFTGGQGLKISLKDITVPQAKAKMIVNGQTVEVYQGQTFFNNKCRLVSLEPYVGGSGKVTVNCGTSVTLEKKISNVPLVVKGNPGNFALGDKVYSAVGKDIYLVYAEKEYGYLASVSPADVAKQPSSSKFFNDLAKQIENNKAKGGDLPAINVGGVKEITLTLIKKGDSPKLEVSFNGANAMDSSLGDYQNYFQDAIDSYDNVEANFGGENYQSTKSTYGEQALWAEYGLADSLSQQESALQILSKIMNQYPESKYNGLTAEQLFNGANLMESSSGTTTYFSASDISLQLISVSSPSADEASVNLNVVVNGVLTPVTNAHFGDVIVNEPGQKVTLKSFDDNTVYVDYDCKIRSTPDAKEISSSGSTQGNRLIDLENKCKVSINVQKISLKKVAQIQLIPITRGRSREANFTFSIGIEKRALALNLTPEQANDKINKLNEQIASYRNITESLGKLIKADKVACLATSAYINIKNLLAGKNGEATARTEVMAKWNRLCADAKFQTDSGANDVESCISKNSGAIEKDVAAMKGVLQGVNNDITNAEKNPDNQNKDGKPNYDKTYSSMTESFKTSNTDLDSLGIVAADKSSFNEVVKDLNSSEGDLSQAEFSSLKKNLAIVNAPSGTFSTQTVEQAKQESISLLSLAKSRQQDRAYLKDVTSGLDKTLYNLNDKNSVHAKYVSETWGNFKTGRIFEDSSLNEKINPNQRVAWATKNGKEYLVTLKGSASTLYVDNWYSVTKTDGKFVLTNVADADKPKSSPVFDVVDKNTYSNVCKNCNYMKVFALEPNKGMPALLPFDDKNGWYVEVKQTAAGLGNKQQAYQDSGQLNSFWICNVGSDGLMEGVGIDRDCARFDFYTGMPTDNLLGLEEAQARTIVRKAVAAVSEAQRQFASNPSTTQIKITGITQNGGKLKVQNSEGNSGSKCTDFMSASDCQKIFNVCDPVVCPSSRCDFGGKFKVDDVIQSGIVGSTMLCLPNFIGFDKETGVVVPVCLTGISAGIEGWTSILENYRDCINESVTTGRSVGVCDALHSVYVCDFFWRQVGPFTNALLKNAFLTLFGKQESKGGGEYMFVQDAWNNAEKSMGYFQTNYAKDSKLSFGTKELTSTLVAEVCKSPASATYPSNFDAMLEPESPVQFHAFFEELSYTTATVPARSQYNVFYHIYAGKDQGHYYQIYLKNAPETSGYLTKDIQIVASGYVPQGEYASETKNFIDISGFKELCVRIDSVDKCGFKSVSTSAALTAAKDMAAKSAAEQAVTTESECVNGGSSVGSFLTPNIGQGVNEFANPAIYNQGIIRVCSSKNPGDNAAASRWKDVGYCDNSGIRCWVDTNSVKKAIVGAGLENATLNDLETMSIDNLVGQGYYGSVQAREELNKLYVIYDPLKNEKDAGQLKIKIEGKPLSEFDGAVLALQNKFAMSSDKAELLFYKAQVYDNVANVLGKTALTSVAAVAPVSNPDTKTTVPAVDDATLMAKMIYGETSGQPIAQRVAAGWVAMNRVTAGTFQKTLAEVITSGEFHGYTEDKAPTPEYIVLAKKIINKEQLDNTDGATFFFHTFKTQSEIISLFEQCGISVGDYKFIAGGPNQKGMYVYYKYCSAINGKV